MRRLSKFMSDGTAREFEANFRENIAACFALIRPDPRPCPRCSYELRNAGRFCGHCGLRDSWLGRLWWRLESALRGFSAPRPETRERRYAGTPSRGPEGRTPELPGDSTGIDEYVGSEIARITADSSPPCRGDYRSFMPIVKDDLIDEAVTKIDDLEAARFRYTMNQLIERGFYRDERQRSWIRPTGLLDPIA